MLRCIFAVLCVALFSVFFPVIHAEEAVVKPSDIPAETFAALPNFSNPKLSASGKKLAYFIEKKGRINLFVRDLDGSDSRLIGPNKKFEYSNFYWKNDEVLLLVLRISANRRTDTRILSYNLITNKFKWLGRPKGLDSKSYTSQHDSIIDFLPHDSENILLSLHLEHDIRASVYKVNVRTGDKTTIQHSRKGVVWWNTDNNSNVRLGTGFLPNSNEYIIKYKTAAGDWINLSDEAWVEDYEIEGFAPEPDIMYVRGPSKAGTNSILKLNALSGELLEDTISNENYDINNVVLDPVSGKLVGVSYIDDFWEVHYFNKNLNLIQRGLKVVLPDTINSIVSKAHDKELYLIKALSDRNPGDYYVYDREDKTLDYLISARRQIDERIMASTKAVSIPVRDGSVMPGYLTVPFKTETKNLPTIILPHGGPSSRDSAEWDYEAQFYASRGWLVLKPNFRGSTGYGPAYKNAGKKQWGGLMQDDVTDATNWLISEGMADPDRICIVGSSYGGYAALMGVIKEPNLYKCAISTNGVTDMVKLKLGDRKYIGGKAWIKNMGLEGADDKEVSPYHRAEDVSVPVLLIAAKDDTRVPYTMSKDMYKRLKRLKKTVEYVEIKKGTHHLVTAEARLLRLQAAEKFLAKHIGY